MVSSLYQAGAGALTSMYDMGFSYLYFGMTIPLVYQAGSRLSAWASHYWKEANASATHLNSFHHRVGVLTALSFSLVGTLSPSLNKAIYAIPLLIRRLAWPVFKRALQFTTTNVPINHLFDSPFFKAGYLVHHVGLLAVSTTLPLVCISLLRQRNQFH